MLSGHDSNKPKRCLTSKLLVKHDAGDNTGNNTILARYSDFFQTTPPKKIPLNLLYDLYTRSWGCKLLGTEHTGVACSPRESERGLGN